jgi:curved DNA-binding protein CbpA
MLYRYYQMSENLEYRPKNDIPDLYHILGLTIYVCKDDNCDEIIKRAYTKKAKICHPDKNPGRTEAIELFELLTSAYDIIKDPVQRKAYNNKLSLNRQSSSDFFKLKQGATDYAKSIGEYKPPTDEQRISFEEQKKLMNQKHGYDPDSAAAKEIKSKDARKKLEELTKTRKEDAENLKPEILFDEGRFDLRKFNAAFDVIHKRNENDMVLHNGIPSAWNDMGGSNNFSAFDDLDNLYTDDATRLDTSRQSYGSIDFTSPVSRLSKSDIHDIKGADYVDNHNVIETDYTKNIKAKLRDRENESKQYDKMVYGDYKRDDTAGYGILDKLGITVDDRLTFDLDEEDISEKYNKLMLERQQDFKMNGHPERNPVPLPRGGR